MNLSGTDGRAKGSLPEPILEHPLAAERTSASDSDRAGYLRIGVMLDDWTDRAWIAKIIEDIQGSDFARVVTVILNRSPSPSLWHRLRTLFPTLLYAIYYRMDRKLFRRWFRPDAFDSVDLKPLLQEVELVEVTPRRRKFTDTFDSKSIEQIRQQDLDVILRFGFRIILGPILETARRGVWSFHHGDNRAYRGGPSMFWEMHEGNPVCGVTLQILTDQLDGGKVIDRTIEKTNFFSLYLNRNRNYWKATESVLRRLRQLRSDGWPAFENLETFREQVTYSKGIYRTPGNLAMLSFLMKLFGRMLRRLFSDLLTEEQWSIAWRRRPAASAPEAILAGGPFRLLRPPRGYFYADPFLFVHQGRHLIFFEDYEYASKRAAISWIELDGQGSPSKPRVAISTDYHLSYPYVFEHDGQIYMIPETRASRRIELWRAAAFPDRWEFDRVLLDNIRAVDATWLHYQDQYWLFAGVAVDGGMASSELHVFSSAKPLGPWQPHRGNPVVTSIEGARPAGKLFLHNGRLIRPGQDCAKIYGHRVNLYHVEQLDDHCYRETQVGVIQPDWLPNNIGTHTYNSTNDYETIDGRVCILRGLRLKRR